MQPLFYKIHQELPLFAIPNKGDFIIYTSGYFTVLKDFSKEQLRDFFNQPNICNDTETRQVIENLLETAKNNIHVWNAKNKQTFNPECLTIHTGSECNLNCSYCYSKQQNITPKGFPGLSKVKGCLEFMLANMPKNNKTLNIVYHGSGEPTYHWNKLVEANNFINEFARQNKRSTFKYIATNGIISKEKAIWLAQNINVIGISCDGPGDIQEIQRQPLTNSNLSLKQTCKTIADAGGRFEIRTTITQETINKQKQIATYLIQELNAPKIRFEPFYLSENSFSKAQANTYYMHFIEAQNYAAMHNVELSYSGLRMDEMHASFCDQFRNNLRLTPSGIINNCFYKFTDKENNTIGKIIKNKVQLNLKTSSINVPQVCNECINLAHCSRGCPDYCIFDNTTTLNEFKCELHKIIAVNNIIELAEHAV